MPAAMPTATPTTTSTTKPRTMMHQTPLLENLPQTTTDAQIMRLVQGVLEQRVPLLTEVQAVLQHSLRLGLVDGAHAAVDAYVSSLARPTVGITSLYHSLLSCVAASYSRQHPHNPYRLSQLATTPDRAGKATAITPSARAALKHALAMATSIFAKLDPWKREFPLVTSYARMTQLHALDGNLNAVKTLFNEVRSRRV